MTRWVAWSVVVLAACGDKGDESAACDPLVGSVFTLDGGGGTVRGTLTFPAGLEDGLQVGVMIGSGGAFYGLVPDDITAPPSTCGGPMDFEIQNLDPGTYELQAEVTGDSLDDVRAAGTYDGTFTSDDDEVVGIDVTLAAP